MISIQTADGEFVKVLHNVKNERFGFHSLFGFISEEKANERLEVRARKGFEFDNSKWHCLFTINSSDDNKTWELNNLQDCKAKKEKENWSLETPFGSFSLSNNSLANTSTFNASVNDFAKNHELNEKFLNKIKNVILSSFAVFITVMFFLQSNEVIDEEKKVEKKQIAVKIIKQVNTVNVQRKAKQNIKVKPLTAKQKSHRAVKRNLGFLGLVGSKSLSKVTGGVPTKLKAATAGAGAGGDAGSGGEVLVGLGKGVKKTTVGNTGVAGLGGVGTKGAGGGKGGYGNTLVASGEGQGISAIAVSSSEMVLDGGLSRYAVNATIAKYINQVRRCYEDALKTNSALEGLVSVNFEINGLGRLNHSRVNKSSLGNKNVESCITTKMMNWQFPKPKGGVNVNVNYPFMLRPVGN
jgi:hypothetical protein